MINISSYHHIEEYVERILSEYNNKTIDHDVLLYEYDKKYTITYLTKFKDKYLLSSTQENLDDLEFFIKSESDLYNSLKPTQIVNKTDRRVMTIIRICSDLKDCFVYDDIYTDSEISSILHSIEQIEQYIPKPFSYSNNGTFDEQLDFYYNKCLDSDIPNQLYAKYIKENYTGYNLLLNLKAFSSIIEKNVSVLYDEQYDEYKTSTVELSHEWWKKILESESSIDVKYSEIAIRNYMFTDSQELFRNIVSHTDRFFISEENLSIHNLTYNTNYDLREYMLNYIIEHTDDDCILYITPNLIKHIPITHKVESDKSSIMFIGKWHNRMVYVVDTKEIKVLNGLNDNGIFYVNSGNTVTINPCKPLVYVNIIENPYLEKPMMFINYSRDYNYHMNNTKLLYLLNEI